MTASEEIWFLGGQFLHDIIGKLEVLKRDHNKDPQKNHLFIQQKYELVTAIKHNCNHVTEDPDHNDQYDLPGKLINEMIHLLNSRPAMPKYVVFILGPEILHDENYIKIGFKTVFTWLLDEIQFALIDRLTSIPEKVQNAQKPEVIFVKMLPRPESSATSYFKAGRRKFNKLLESQLKEFKDIKFTFININEITSEVKDYFNKDGSLNHSGELAYWISFSDIIKTKLKREIEKTKPVEQDAQTEDFLLDDYIKIQAEKIVTERNSTRDRQPTDNYRSENQDRPRSNYYEDRQRPIHRRTQSYEYNDRFHYYRRNSTRPYHD